MINTVTWNALCLWVFEEGEEGRCSGQDRSGGCNCKQKGEKNLPKISLYESKNWKSICVSLLLLISEEP